MVLREKYFKKMVNGRILWTLLFTVFAFQYSFGSYKLNHLTTKNGLSQDFVNVIAQDSLGYLWVGTGTGISKYDGNKFLNYDASDGLLDNYVSSIFTKGNQVFVGLNNGGLNLIINDQIDTIILPDVIGDKINSISTLDNNTILIGTNTKGVFIYNIKTQEISTIWNHPDAMVSDILQKDAENVIILSNVGIYSLNIQSGFTEKISNDIAKSIVQNPFDNSIWYLNTNGALKQISSATDNWSKYTQEIITSNYGDLVAFNFSKSGALFFITENYLCSILSPTTDPSISVISKQGISSYACKDFFIDNESNIWVGTYGTGLIYAKKEVFYWPDVAHGSNINTIEAVSEALMYLGTDKGLWEYNPINQKIQRNLIVDSTMAITAIATDPKNRLWVGTANHGLNIYGVPLPNENFNQALEALNNTEITDIEINGNNVWVSTIGNGVYLFELTSHSVQNFNTTNILLHNDIYALFMDSRSNLWLSTESSKMSYIRSNLQLESIDLMDASNSINMSIINEDKKGNIWIGTLGSGMWKFSEDNVINFGSRNGLPSNFILSAICGSNSTWVAYTGGVSSISNDSIVTSYSDIFDLSDIDFNSNSSALIGDKIFWGTRQGLLVQDLNLINNFHEIEVFIKEVKVNGKKIDYSSIQNFDAKRHAFEIKIQANSLSRNNHILFQHKISSENEDFLSSETSDAHINYPGLSFGKYKYSVRTKVIGGKWSGWKMIYAFEIDTPIYYKWWFLLIVGITIPLVLILFYVLRLRKVRTDKRKLESIVRKRTLEIEIQKKLIETAHDELEHTHGEITASIHYAKGLQDAILPNPKNFLKELMDGFLIFLPKDIVSGDFYWSETISTKSNSESLTFIAAADCTGHGVPGALVHMICSTALDRAVKEYKLKDAGQILNKVRELVVEKFEKSEEQIMDGMDICFCVINRKENSLQFSGANNPLWIIRKRLGTEEFEDQDSFNENYYLKEFKGTKQPVGIYEYSKPFVSTNIKLLEGDVLYLFTDGYADQFGGLRGKKYKYKPFKNLLLNNAHLPMKEQQDLIVKEFDHWKGSHDQIDDVCIIGLKI